MLLHQGGLVLVQLSLDQVAKLWDVIKYSVERSLPPIVRESPDTMNNILANLLSSAMQCWISYSREDSNKFEGVVVTEITLDRVDRSKALLIYSLYGYEVAGRGSWLEGYVALSKWARSEGCSKIIGYTNSDKAIRVAKGLGGDTDYTFISVPIGREDEDIH